MCAGLALLGVALKHHWHWALVGVFWGLFIFAIMTSTVTVSGTWPYWVSTEKNTDPVQLMYSTVSLSNRRPLLPCLTSPVFSSASQLCCTKPNGEKLSEMTGLLAHRRLSVDLLLYSSPLCRSMLRSGEIQLLWIQTFRLYNKSFALARSYMLSVSHNWGMYIGLGLGLEFA